MHSALSSFSPDDIVKAKILLVDDDKLNTAILNRALKDFDNTYEVHSGAEAIEFCKQTPPDLVILDVLMPIMNGYQTCKILKTLPQMENCPVIFSTSLESTDDELACWEAGGSDFVTKPVYPQTLMKRISSHLQLKLKYDAQQELAYFDSLTGLGNRRHYNAFYNEQLALAARYQKELSIVVLDVDYFKKYNDKYGHQQGDKCLIDIANAIKSQLHRPTDAAMRYGGEEFVLILPNTNLQGATFIANNIITQIVNQQLPHVDSPYKYVTISAGVSSLKTNKTNKTNEDLFVVADKQLYEAKKIGRNACA